MNREMTHRALTGLVEVIYVCFTRDELRDYIERPKSREGREIAAHLLAIREILTQRLGEAVANDIDSSSSDEEA